MNRQPTDRKCTRQREERASDMTTLVPEGGTRRQTRLERMTIDDLHVRRVHLRDGEWHLPSFASCDRIISSNREQWSVTERHNRSRRERNMRQTKDENWKSNNRWSTERATTIDKERQTQWTLNTCKMQFFSFSRCTSNLTDPDDNTMNQRIQRGSPARMRITIPHVEITIDAHHS